MNQVGFGILKDGVPAGLWPLPFQAQSNAAHRYKTTHPLAEISVVPIFVGNGVEPAPFVEVTKESA